MPHILLVDDDHDITSLLSGYLERYGFTVSCACDGDSMRACMRDGGIDLVVLDWMLPGEDGLKLAGDIRQQSRTPVIMLTARAGRFDSVMSLEGGADDYMSKPFEPRELVARIHAVLRRVREHSSPAVQPQEASVVWFDGWRLHRLERHITSPGGTVLPLSNAEYRLLSTFVNHPRKLLSRDRLLDEARGREVDAYDRSIDLLVSRLRQKLAKAEPEVELIKTVRGAGYLFDVQQLRPLAH